MALRPWKEIAEPLIYSIRKDQNSDEEGISCTIKVTVQKHFGNGYASEC